MDAQFLDRDALAWRTATFSSNGACVEVAPVVETNEVAVRHSRRPDAEVIVYNAAEWRAFIAGAKHGEFDTLVH